MLVAGPAAVATGPSREPLVPSPPRVALFSVHYLKSKRRADPHFIAAAFHRLGWDVVFVTVSISHLSRLRGDDRFAYPIGPELGRIVTVEERLRSFIWHRPWHPVNLRHPVLNALSAPFFARYGAGDLGAVRPLLVDADLLVFESTAGIMLFDQLKALNPRARVVYRVSDDMRVIGNHPVVIAAEERIGPRFDLVSLPARTMRPVFGRFGNVAFHRHGLDSAAFDQPSTSPYEPGTVNAISVGATLFDAAALADAADACPDWRFHVFTWHRDLPTRRNIIVYDERPFAETVPYIRHADIGLALYIWRKGAENLADSSLKMIQYAYCQLPTVAPAFARAPDAPHVFGYQPGDAASIAAALRAARAFDRRAIDPARIGTWEDLARHIATGAPDPA